MKSYFIFILFAIILFSGTTPFSFSQNQEESQMKTFASLFPSTVMTEYVKYILQFQITDGKITEITPYCKLASLVIQIEPNQSGELVLDIPRVFLDSKIQDSMDDEFFVILDGEEIAFDEIKNENSRKIIIQLTEDSKELEILGSNPLAGQNVSCKITHNPPYSYLLPPLKQMENGITPTDVICKEELSKIYSPMSKRTACVGKSSEEKLVERGWTSMIQKINPCDDPLLRETSILKCG